MDLLANPQSTFLSPAFLLVLLFGVIRGIKIEIWLHLVIGMFGVFRLARYYRQSQAAAVLSSFVFMLSSMYALSITAGMSTFLTIAFIPWAILYYLESFSNLKYVFLSSLFCVLMFFAGGVQVLIITLTFIAAHSFLSVLCRQHRLIRALKTLVIILIIVSCLSAVKSLPFQELVLQRYRFTTEYDGFSLNSLRFGLFSRDQSLAAIAKLPEGMSGFINGVSYAMDENGMYVGIIPFLLFLIGLGLFFKKRIVLVLSFLIFLWLGFGNRIPFSLWELLHRLPIYNSMRVAQRFRFVFMLCLSIFAGFGFDAVSLYIRRIIVNRFIVRFIMLTILFVVLVDLMLVNSDVLKDAFPFPPLKTLKSDTFRQVETTVLLYEEDFCISSNRNFFYYKDDGWGLYPGFLCNIGVINAYEPLFVPTNVASMHSNNYKGEVYLRGTQGEVQISKWSPNRVRVDVNALSKGYLVFNQNYNSGWKIKGGRDYKTVSLNGLVGTVITPEDKEIEFYYLSDSFIIGSTISLITFLFIIILLLKTRSRTAAEFNNLIGGRRLSSFKIVLLLFVLSLFILVSSNILIKRDENRLGYISGVDQSDLVIAIDYASEGKFKEARKQYKKNVENNRLSAASKRALKVLKDLNKAVIDKDYVIHLFKGDKYFLEDFQTGDHERAIKEYKAAMEINPNYAEAYVGLGGVYYYSGRKKQAIPYFEKALQLNPGDSEAYFLTGSSYRELSEVEEARGDLVKAKELHEREEIYFKKSVELDPKNSSSCCNLAQAYKVLGGFKYRDGDLLKAKELYEQAEINFKKAIELDPEISVIYNYLAQTYVLLGKTYRESAQMGLYYSPGAAQRGQAIAYLKKAIQLNPDEASAYRYLGQSYRDLAQIEEIKGNLKKAGGLFEQARDSLQKAKELYRLERNSKEERFLEDYLKLIP
ncbi:MAG: tetratricopeptide repeat protein [Candidatus Omnitrophota bacterium]